MKKTKFINYTIHLLIILLLAGMLWPTQTFAFDSTLDFYADYEDIFDFRNDSNIPGGHSFALTDSASNKAVRVYGAGFEHRFIFADTLVIGGRGGWHQGDQLIVKDNTQGTQYQAQWRDNEFAFNVGLQIKFGYFRLGYASEIGTTHAWLNLEESPQNKALPAWRVERDLYSGTRSIFNGYQVYLRWAPAKRKGLQWETGTYVHQVDAYQATSKETTDVRPRPEGNFLDGYSKTATYLKIGGPIAWDSWLDWAAASVVMLAAML